MATSKELTGVLQSLPRLMRCPELIGSSADAACILKLINRRSSARRIRDRVAEDQMRPDMPPSVEQPIQALLHLVCDIQCQRLDCRSRIHAGTGDKQAAIHDEQVLHVVAAPPFVDD